MNTQVVKNTVTWTHADTGRTETVDYLIARYDRGGREADRTNEARTDAHKRKLADYSLACEQGKATAVKVISEPLVLTGQAPGPPT